MPRAERPINPLEKRRKQLSYRANHRGIKEMDIILGQFAKQFVGEFNKDQLNRFEHLMEQNDRDLLSWFTGEITPNEEIDKNMFEAILTHATNALK